jgi:GT2 family glycosyltransferase
MDLSILIVNWNSAEYLSKCLESIYANTCAVDFEIVVVDNASFDGSGEMLRTTFPNATFLQSSRNLGFAGANNLAFASCSGDHLLFLNPDTEVCGSAISDMLSALRSIPDAGAVGCKLLNSDLTAQISCIQPFPTILNQVLDSDYLIRRFPSFSAFGVRPLYHYRGTPEPVQVISGACLMMKRRVFEAVGRFCTDYFMYAEDLDLCFKIQKAGYRSYYVGQTSVIHFGGGSAGKVNHFNDIVKRQSIAVFFAKHSGTLVSYSYRASTLFVSIARLCIGAILFAVAPSNRKCAIGIAIKKWTKVLRWSVGLETWAAHLRNAVVSDDELLKMR